ncbi:MAG TPA: phosphate ABC transporter permease subunit PstC [Streptosporangiaceae bacterium]|jgi:phosphate transport system permease protein
MATPAVVPGGEAAQPPPRPELSAFRRWLRAGSLIRWLGLGGAVIPTLMLAFILVVLFVKAWPAIQINGWGFFTKSVWHTGAQYGGTVKSHGLTYLSGQSYGAVPQIVGTLETSAIALIIAVPVSIGAALVVVERLPGWLASVVGGFLELLAGIPSVVIGLWGVLTFGPFIAHDIAPVLDKIPIPFFQGDVGHGQGLLVSGLVLAVMVIPIIASTARDLIRQVPLLPREGAVALGMSDAECARKVTLPWVGSGLVGAIVLGLARALGETIAVAMVCGVALSQVATNLYAAMITIAANIVQNLDTVITDQLGVRTYAELALVLLLITLAANVLARLLVRRVSGTALPVGRGL